MTEFASKIYTADKVVAQLFAQPYMSAAGAAMTVPLDHQAISMVVEAGSAGITLAVSHICFD